MSQPTRILAAALVLAAAATAAHARAPASMPERMPAALSAAMSAPTPSTMPTFRHVTSLGTTKPPGAALDARGGTGPRLDAESRRLARAIRTAVCTGC